MLIFGIIIIGAYLLQIYEHFEHYRRWGEDFHLLVGKIAVVVYIASTLKLW